MKGTDYTEMQLPKYFLNPHVCDVVLHVLHIQQDLVTGLTTIMIPNYDEFRQ